MFEALRNKFKTKPAGNEISHPITPESISQATKILETVIATPETTLTPENLMSIGGYSTEEIRSAALLYTRYLFEIFNPGEDEPVDYAWDKLTTKQVPRRKRHTITHIKRQLTHKDGDIEMKLQLIEETNQEKYSKVKSVKPIAVELSVQDVVKGLRGPAVNVHNMYVLSEPEVRYEDATKDDIYSNKYDWVSGGWEENPENETNYDTGVHEIGTLQGHQRLYRLLRWTFLAMLQWPNVTLPEDLDKQTKTLSQRNITQRLPDSFSTQE